MRMLPNLMAEGGGHVKLVISARHGTTLGDQGCHWVGSVSFSASSPSLPSLSQALTPHLQQSHCPPSLQGQDLPEAPGMTDTTASFSAGLSSPLCPSPGSEQEKRKPQKLPFNGVQRPRSPPCAAHRGQRAPWSIQSRNCTLWALYPEQLCVYSRHPPECFLFSIPTSKPPDTPLQIYFKPIYSSPSPLPPP